MGGPSDKLGLNTGIADPLVIGGDSLWNYYNWSTKDNYFLFRTDLDPLESAASGLAAGSYSAFTRTIVVPKLADRIWKARLMWDQAAITKTGGTYVRYCDYAAFAAIDWIELRNVNNVVQRLTGDELWLKHVKYNTTEERDAERIVVGGGLSDAQRNTAGAATQNFIVNLPFYFTQQRGKALSPMTTAVEHKIVIRFKALTSICQTDGSAVSSLMSGIKLRVDSIHTEAHERDAMYELQAMEHGIVYKQDDHSRSYTPFSITGSSGHPNLSGTPGTALTTGEITVPLESHRNSTKVVNVLCRLTVDTDGTSLYNRPYESFHKLPDFKLQSVGGDEIIPYQGNTFLRYVAFPEKYPAPSGTQMLTHEHCEDPCDSNHCNGSLNYGNINRPTIKIPWTTADPSPVYNYTVTVITEEHNFVQHCSGEIIQVITSS